MRTSSFVWQHRYKFAVGGSLLYSGTLYTSQWLAARKRDQIKDDTLLYLRVFPGSIVEEHTPRSTLDLVLSSSDGAREVEPPRVLTIFEIREALNWVATDSRITGIVADFSSISWPEIPHVNLGLAQLEELHGAISTLKQLKASTQQADKDGQSKPFRTIAVTDTFHSQTDFVLATAFDEIYVQPTGDIPLYGLSAAIPFWSKLLKYIGINVHTEARTAWKSMVAPYSQEELSPEQRANELELLGDLNNNLCTMIARSRFPSLEPEAALAKVKDLTMRGPFSASEAKDAGLITDVKYKRQVVNSVMAYDDPQTISIPLPAPLSSGSTTPPPVATLQIPAHLDKENYEPPFHWFGFYHYHRVTERKFEKAKAPQAEVGVVYLLGTIGNDGSEFGSSSVVRGLKEAAECEDIDTVVLRIDSGGGGVVESDTIYDAVRQVKDSGKIVVASFGNAAASGGYLAACDADMILCSPSTVTGSIGVASVRPNVTQGLLDRLKITVETFFLGSKTQSLLHELEGDELERHRKHIDDIYDLFKKQVCDGRHISPDAVEELAGGRVYSGLRAYEMLLPEEERGVFLRQHQNLMLPANHNESTSNAETGNDVGGGEQAFPKDETDQPIAKNDLQPMESPEFGPLGRGLTDGLGGLFEAASTGFSLALESSIIGLKQQNPDMSDEEIMRELLPDVDLEFGEGGVAVPVGIRLRKFPEEKSLWQAAKEAARRGESIDPTMIKAHAGLLLKATLSSLIYNGARQMWSDFGLDAMVYNGGSRSARAQSFNRRISY